MIRAFLISFTFGLLIVWGVGNYIQMKQSLDRCQILVNQIHQRAENL